MKRQTDCKTSLLHDLLEEIEQSIIGDDWSISLDTVLLCLETSPESFYRYYYQAGHSMAHLPETFSSENAGILLGYVENLGYTEATDAFRRRGWFFADEDYRRWEEFFLSVALSLLTSHSIDEEELEIALSGCRSVEDGLHFYCQTACSIEDLLNQALRMYANENNLPPLAMNRLRLHMEQMFKRRLIREETIYSEFRQRLHNLARQRGWAGETYMPAPPSLRDELSLLGFDSMPPAEVLKERYYALLRENHPDVNPSEDAVAVTRRLIEAYTRICAWKQQTEGVLS